MRTLPSRLAPLATSLLLAATLLLTGLPGVSTAAAVTPSADREIMWTTHCMGYERTIVPNKACVFGDKRSRTVVALVGDSHASHLFPAIERIAKARHWKVVVMVKVSCAFIDMRVSNIALGREYTECATWNRNVVARLKVLKPALTLVAASRTATRTIPSTSFTKVGRAIGREMNKVPGKVAVIVDSPWRGQTSPSSGSMGVMERAAAAYTGDPLINLTSATCSRWPCAPKVGTITKYRDRDHFTATFARSILGKSGGTLDRALVKLMP